MIKIAAGISALIALGVLAIAAVAGATPTLTYDGNTFNTGSCASTAIPPAIAARGITTIQWQHAATIATQAHTRQLPSRAVIVALMTALQESWLRNLANPTVPASLALPHDDVGSDHDSLGIFQQRPSTGWGTISQIMTPTYAAGKFFDTLTQLPDWNTLPLTAAAQAVQISAFPDAYATHEPLATAVTEALTTGCSAIPTDTARGAAVVAAAQQWLGTPYVFAGGDKNGPTTGTEPGIGFDCSGLTLHAWAQVGVELPHAATEQARLGTPIPRAAAQPGDLLFFHTPGDPPGYMHHVGIYLGNGEMIHAPTSGDVVKISRVFGDQYWETEIADIRRY